MDIMIERMNCVSWRAYLFAVVGFVGGVISNSFGDTYGVYVGLLMFLLGWWCIVVALVIANRKA